MKKIFKIILVSLVFSGNLFAQNAPNLIFANKESNVGYGGNVLVQKSTKDSNGNNYLIGSFSGIADFDPSAAETNLTAISSQYGDLYIAKYNASGDFLWVKNIGGSGYLNCSAVVIGGNFIYLAGKYTSTIDFDPSTNTFNLTSANGTYEAAYLAKFDLNGAFLTAKSIDGESDLKINSLNFNNSQLLVSGNFSGVVDFDLSTSNLNLSSNGGTDIFIAKYSTLFAPLWVCNIGGFSNEICNSLTVNSIGEIIITGSYLGTLDFDPSAASFTLINASTTIQNTYIAKYSALGGFVWAKDIGGRISGTAVPSIPVITTDTSNNFIIAGYFNQVSDFDPSASVVVNITAYPNNSSYTFLAKYDNNGNYVWVKSFVCTNKGLILNSATSSITIFGVLGSNTDFDPGTPVYNLTIANGTNYFATYDLNGNFVNANNIKPTITNVVNNGNDGIYVTGNFTGTNDFDPSAGVTTHSSVLSNSFLAKYSFSGAFIYVKPIGGNKGTNQTSNFISTDGAGNIYRAGLLSATTDLDPSSNTFNVSSPFGTGIFISKYTPGGSFIWGKTIPGSLGTSLGISVMNTDTSGNTYVIGSVNVDGVLSTNLFKYDSNGNNLWTKQINGTINARRRIVFDAQSNFYISGVLYGNFDWPFVLNTPAIDFDPSDSGTNLLNPTGRFPMGYIAKYNPQGEHLWAKTLTQSGSDSSESIYDFQINNNSLYVAGLFTLSTVAIFSPIVSYFDDAGFVAQYDLNGNYQNSSVFLFTDLVTGFYSNITCSSITFDNDNNYYLTAFIQGSIDVDLSPTSVNILTSLPDGSGNYLKSTAICKYSSNGTLLWAKQINSLNTISVVHTNTLRSFINTNNELILCGTTQGITDFDPSTSDLIISTPNVNGAFAQNIFMAQYNTTTGGLIWANKIDSNVLTISNSVSMNNKQDLFISGQFRETADFDLTSGVQNLTSTNPFAFDRFWAKYATLTLGLEENIASNVFKLFPNPTSGILNFKSETNISKVFIYNMLGQLVQQESINALEGTINIEKLAQGTYIVKIDDTAKGYTIIKN